MAKKLSPWAPGETRGRLVQLQCGNESHCELPFSRRALPRSATAWLACPLSWWKTATGMMSLDSLIIYRNRKCCAGLGCPIPSLQTDCRHHLELCLSPRLLVGGSGLLSPRKRLLQKEYGLQPLRYVFSARSRVLDSLSQPTMDGTNAPRISDYLRETLHAFCEGLEKQTPTGRRSTIH